MKLVILLSFLLFLSMFCSGLAETSDLDNVLYKGNEWSPLIGCGDFNTIVRIHERSGGNGRLSLDSLAFGAWIHELSLIDMCFKGSSFTWRCGKVTDHFIAKRLDRVLCCAQARLKWQEASVTHLPFLSSDHTPLWIQLSPRARNDPSRGPFRFEAAWLTHDSFKELLTASWNTVN